MKKQLLFLLTLFAATSIYAQTDKKVKTVMLTTGVAFDYNEALQDSARIIFTPEGDSLGIKIYLKDNPPTDFLYSQIRYVDFWNGQTMNNDTTNANRNNASDLLKNSEAWRLEFPRLYQGNNVTFEVTHATDDYGITYSLEWDGTKKANRWTCYQMHAGNMQRNAERTNNFTEDPKLPAAYRTTYTDYTGSGYSRGHLCPSGDRLCSFEQNDQTFYMSNMQPQLQSHNGGVWNDLEQRLRDTWAPHAQSSDTLYVVKAATIDDANIMAYTPSNLIVPKYFYMALLYYYKSTNSYTAVGVWSPHAASSTTEYITIDELEARTGIDFFCNLPDAIEEKVESRVENGHW